MKNKVLLKKLLSLLLAAVMSLGLISGCGSDNDSSAPTSPNSVGDKTPDEEKTKLTVWMAGDDAQFMMDSGLPEKFMEENPQYDLEIVQLPWDTLHDKLMAGFTGGELPAVAQGSDHWVGEFAGLGGLMPMEDFRERYEYTDDKFLPNSWDHFRYTDGKVYAAPFVWESRVLFYRKDLLEEAGYTEPPKTWDEMLEYGEKLGNGEDRFALAHQDGWLDFHFFSSILYSMGGDMFNSDANACILNDEKGQRALNYYQSLYNNNVIPKDPEKRVEAFKGFKEGYYAMAHSGAWWFGLLNSQAPELEGKWGVALLPTDETETGYGHPNPWLIPVNAKNPDGVNKEGAEAWISFMMDKENSIVYADTFGSLPPTKDAYEDPIIKENENLMIMYDAIMRGTNSIHNVPNAETISEVIWNALADIRDNVKPVADVTNDMVATVDGYLS